MLLLHDFIKMKKAEAAKIINSSVHNALKVEERRQPVREAEVLFSITLELQLLFPFAPICISGTEENILLN